MLKNLKKKAFGESDKKTPDPNTENIENPPPVDAQNSPRGEVTLRVSPLDNSSKPLSQEQEMNDIEIIQDGSHAEENEESKTEQKKNKMSQFQDYTKKKVKAAQDAIKERTDKLQVQSKEQLQKGKEKIVKGKEHFNELTGEIRKNLDTIRNDVKASINSHVKEFMTAQKDKLNHWLRLQVEKSVIKVLSKAPPKIKKSLKSPGMWKWVEKLTDDLVDEVWPEMEEEILYQLRVKMNKPYVEVPAKKRVNCLLRPLYWFKNWYLYTTDPVDMNFWQRSRTISYWILVLIKMVPWWGVQPFFFTLVFLMIDKRDEYQLVKFILQFKKYQFITAGLINGVIGYILYFICASVGKFESYADFADCTTSGPGVGINIYVDVVSFLLQIVLVWICFFLLPFSAPKGKPKFKYVQSIKDAPEKESRCCFCIFNAKRGGRLKKFMVYDMITSLLAIGLFFVIYFALESKELWQAKSTIYFCKLLYGMLSFPFLIFALPILPTLLTKSRPTAYNKDGNCVPAIDAIETRRVPDPRDEDDAEDLLGVGGNGFEELFEQPQQTDQSQFE